MTHSPAPSQKIIWAVSDEDYKFFKKIGNTVPIPSLTKHAITIKEPKE